MHEEDDPLRASSSHQLPDDAVVQGGPEEGPAHLDFILGSDSDVLISLGAKPHQPLNATFPQRVSTRIGNLDREGNEVNSEPSQKVTDVKYRFRPMFPQVSTLALVALFGGDRFGFVLLLCQSKRFENYLWTKGTQGRFSICFNRLSQLESCYR